MNKKLAGYPSIDRSWLKYYAEEAVNYFNYVNNGNERSIFWHIKESNSERLNFIALEYFGIKISYQKLFQEIETLAKALKANEIGKGDFVTLCLPNIPEMVYFIYALNRIGATACLVDPRTNAEGILQRVNESNSKIIVVARGEVLCDS